MDYQIFDQNQWLFPDIVRNDGKLYGNIVLLKGQTVAFQIQATGLPVNEPIRWKIDGLDGIKVQLYREKEICVNRNTSELVWGELTTKNWDLVSRYRLRKAPYRGYDPLVPVDGLYTEKEHEVYCILLVPDKTAPSGTYSGIFSLMIGTESIKIPLNIQVEDKELPERTLQLTNWMGLGNVASKHSLKYGSKEHVEMVRSYIKSMVDCHQNIFMIFWNDLKAERVSGKPIFDFSTAKMWAEIALECGIEKLEWAPFVTRPRYDEPPFQVVDITDGGKRLDCLTTAGRKYLTAFLDQFNSFLTENGWRDISLVHICDEPKEFGADDFRIIAGIFRKYLPGIKLIDAVEIFFIQDALDIYVPKNYYYQQFRSEFEALRDERNELWFYTCNCPGGRFLNRLLDAPLLNTRLLHWGNYRFNLTGYLHWAYFQVSKDQDAFEQTSGADWLPAGDTHIVYPGENGPLISLRWLQMKCGTEDYEILRTLSQYDKAKADELCTRAIYTFDDYVTDTEEFDNIRTELIKAYVNCKS